MDGTRTQPMQAPGFQRKRIKSLSISVLYLIVVGLLLVGYSFFNRGFAYIGYTPIFVGEVVLGIGLFAVVAGGGSLRFLRSPITWVLLLFMTWQVLILLPGLSKYGFLALRDSVIWLYSIFAILVSAALMRSRAFAKVPEWYFFFLPAWALVSPFLFVLTELFSASIPQHPGTDVPIIHIKPGDMGVQIAGAAAFLALGLHRQFRRSVPRYPAVQEIYLWVFLLMGLIACGSRNRGGLLAPVVACAFVTLFKPLNRLTRILLPLLIVILFAFAIALKVSIGGEREISLGQIYDNIESVLVKSEKKELTGTAQWRIEWWNQILDDTVYGDNFWTGVGYGVSLAKRHGFADDTGNRSPHNGHLTILARSGVPGIVLWITLLATVFFCLLRANFAARAARQPAIGNLMIWVLGFLMAFIFNASFDVFLEGPQGGIWFWCLIGYAIALTEEQRALSARTNAQPARQVRRGATAVRQRV